MNLEDKLSVIAMTMDFNRAHACAKEIRSAIIIVSKARRVVHEQHRIHKNDPEPQKYRAAFGAIAELALSLGSADSDGPDTEKADAAAAALLTALNGSNATIFLNDNKWCITVQRVEDSPESHNIKDNGRD